MEKVYLVINNYRNNVIVDVGFVTCRRRDFTKLGQETKIWMV